MKMANAGVRTRAQAWALAAAAAASSSRKRKVNDVCYSIKRRVITPPAEINSVELNSGDRTRCSSASLDSDHDSSASCCSSNNGSSDVDNQRIIKLADLQDERSNIEAETSDYCNCNCGESSSSLLAEETSDELDSSARPILSSTNETNSHPRPAAAAKMPTESELDDFFAEAEKNSQKQFADKYNYDIVKDEPLRGRYEWVRLKP